MEEGQVLLEETLEEVPEHSYGAAEQTYAASEKKMISVVCALLLVIGLAGYGHAAARGVSEQTDRLNNHFIDLFAPRCGPINY